MTDKLGYIHSVLTGGTLDGPGIRYVIFMQMCPFRCLYCHNPDTWFKNSLGARTVDSVYNDILKYKDFFNFSGGGVTLSGGEPLLQVGFVLSLFKKLKQINIHTCLDTCGYVDLSDDIKNAITLCDLVMLDIKHLDSQMHLKLTGKDNKKVLDFLDYLYSIRKKTRIRQVLVPSFTTDEKYIDKLIGFLDKYRAIIEKVELLPYHKMGIEKWQKLGLEYKLDVDEPKKELVQGIRNKFVKYGFEVI